MRARTGRSVETGLGAEAEVEARPTDSRKTRQRKAGIIFMEGKQGGGRIFLEEETLHFKPIAGADQTFRGLKPGSTSPELRFRLGEPAVIDGDEFVPALIQFGVDLLAGGVGFKPGESTADAGGE